MHFISSKKIMTSSLSYSCTRSSITNFSFWESVKILLNKPHVVNKRLWGCKTLFNYNCKPIVPNWNLSLNCERLKNTHNIEEFKKYLLDELQIKECSEVKLVQIVLIELLPKTYGENHAFQLVVLQKENGVVTFYDVTEEGLQQNLCPDFPYSIRLDHEEIVLTAVCDTPSKSFQWLRDTVLPQFMKWGEECPNKEKRHICNESLSLVSNEKYYIKYNDLKLKYGKEMVKIWPESTDPSKFVYEDIAIATYLLLLWEDEKSHLNTKNQQTFVDLGCGNGLLVYILTKEGHYGVGIDVRKRQIWDMYSTDVKLEENTITPSDTHLFPETDWVIGNHSDELTPWIPVIAARSSYECNFFLLPCCAYNFDGTRYQRQNSSKSQYTEYLEHIKQLCEDCGFKTDTDRLKIPSTKRICLVGRGRTYPHEEHDKYCNSIHNIINTKTNCVQGDNKSGTSWIKDFKARDPVERVRNCTQIDKTIIESIVDSISKHLLEGCSFGSNWIEGRTVDIAEVVQLISQDKLKSLKSECGGLQTLLRNNHHIFKVQSGKVQFRHPKTIKEVTNGFKSSGNKASIKLKEKLCWFHNHHPQGCPLTDNDCSFLHVKK